MGLLACLATSNFKRSLGKMVYLLGSFGSPALETRTAADSWQAEGASLESCLSASSAHGTARTEAQRLALLSCLATTNIAYGVRAGSLLEPCSENANPCR